jgi:hypothetical protein
VVAVTSNINKPHLTVDNTSKPPMACGAMANFHESMRFNYSDELSEGAF